MTGRLEADCDADVIALTANPVDDIAVLGDATAVTYVWRRGALVKDETAARPEC